ncbi:TfoX/Sxy family DNA transformation protein [Vibrio tubiashii]|uniref:TfoX/Sxy family DNA transformation protein n=1 Tax=Vibrio tubiashii TaxID=29498 RepID=UPI001EFCAF4A|nr:TfoX/Sxy family DNA transformation protein [Vibrio tubiashii]MCG9575448.1 TfoX/Sxy family DNA transformation protein [Vibrio tubiashii]
MILDTMASHIEQNCGLNNLIIRSMFGGLVFFSNDVPFGLTLNGAFYIRASDETKKQFISLGYPPHSYEKGNVRSRHTVTTRYFKVPRDVTEDLQCLKSLIQEAYEQSSNEQTSNKAIVPRIKDLPNMQLNIERMLKKVGVTTAYELEQVGAEVAYQKLRKANNQLTQDLLYKLQGAILGKHYLVIKADLEHKEEIIADEMQAA